MVFLPRSAPSSAAFKSCRSTWGCSRFGKTSKTTSGAKKPSNSAPRHASFYGLKISPCHRKIAGRVTHFGLQSCGAWPRGWFEMPAYSSLVSRPAESFQNGTRLFDCSRGFGIPARPIHSEGFLPRQTRAVTQSFSLGNGLGVALNLHSRPYSFARSFTICSGFTRALSTVKPQCRCGPVTRPVAPTLPSTAPASKASPTFTPISERCP